MPDYPIQGRLRIRAENFERDIAFIKEHVAEVSRPQLKSYPGFEHIRFWWVDFAATAQQWQALEPELDKRNISVTMYEGPALYTEAPQAAEQTPAEIERQASLPWIRLLGLIILVAGVISLAIIQSSTLSIGLIALGFLLMTVGRPLIRIVQARLKTGAGK